MPTLSEYKALLQADHVDPAVLTALEQDSRIGAGKLLAAYRRRQDHQAAEAVALRYRSRYERKLWKMYSHVAGLDEVGRGPLAGPVVTAAVILPHQFKWPVNDSKQLTAHERDVLYPHILTEAIAVGIGVADNHEIDRENIYHATELAMAQAVSHLRVAPEFLLVDAMHVPVNLPQERLIKGDANSISIAAASIVAKVIRDRLMVMYDQVYPGYDFKDNMGYGTKAHLAGLAAHGVTPIHRRSFGPVRNCLKS